MVHIALNHLPPSPRWELGGGVESHREPCVGLMFVLILAPRGLSLLE